jgi:hypothetical protein
VDTDVSVCVREPRVTTDHIVRAWTVSCKASPSLREWSRPEQMQKDPLVLPLGLFLPYPSDPAGQAQGSGCTVT